MKKLFFLFLLIPSIAFAQIQPGEPYYKQYTNNTDIRGLVERIDAFIFEVGMSASSRVSDISAADMARIEAFNTALLLYRNVIVSLPVIDAPHSHPMELAIQFRTDEWDKEMFNIGLRDLLMLYAMMSVEMSASQSTEIASGLLPADLQRFDILMARINEYIETYLKAVQPFDGPENQVRRSQDRRGN